MGDPERDYGTTFVNEVGKLRGRLYYDLLDLDGSGSNPEQEQVAKEGAERLRKIGRGPQLTELGWSRFTAPRNCGFHAAMVAHSQSRRAHRLGVRPATTSRGGARP